MEIRATLKKKTGEIEDVTSAVAGAQEYFSAWKHNVDMPHDHSIEGWQCSDEHHPAGMGTPAYRVAYKTLKMVPYPPVSLNWPNLRVRIANGDLDRGGIKFDDVIPGRKSYQYIIPENGRIVHYGDSADGAGYLHCPNLNFAASAWQENVKAVSYVEIIWASTGGVSDVKSLLEAGRNAISPLLAMFEFEFGPRLLSTQILEEVGTVFEDWHWNRRIFSGTVYAETQASFVHLNGERAVERLRWLIERNQSITPDERNRLRLASRWYWSVQEATDEVLEFTQWWLIIECLEMIKTTDIRPVRERLAQLLQCDESALRQPIGRLFGLRSKLLHGEDRSIATEPLNLAKAIACLLLAARIEVDISHDLERVKSLLTFS